jgi:acyl-CoA thioesterase-1
MSASTRGLAAAFALAFTLAIPGLAQACPHADMPTPSLPHLRAALASQHELMVVTLGSSSTQGWMASDPAHTYPAVLQQALHTALPGAHVAVINRGIGGQDAPEELARLVPDVIAVQPQLVIWQVGANGAMRGSDPSVFQAEVAKGVAELHAAGADVILMDNQRSPRVLAASEHVKMERALASVAETSGASLFARSVLMDTWQAEGQPYARFVAADDLHQNDLGYDCVAEALAVTITDALHKPAALMASAKAPYFRQQTATLVRAASASLSGH